MIGRKVSKSEKTNGQKDWINELKTLSETLQIFLLLYQAGIGSHRFIHFSINYRLNNFQWNFPWYCRLALPNTEFKFLQYHYSCFKLRCTINGLFIYYNSNWFTRKNFCLLICWLNVKGLIGLQLFVSIYLITKCVLFVEIHLCSRGLTHTLKALKNHHLFISTYTETTFQGRQKTITQAM